MTRRPPAFDFEVFERNRALRRRQRLMWAIVVAFPVICIPLAIALWPDPPRSESVTVSVDFLPGSSTYAVGSEGTLTSSVGADYKGRGYRQTVLSIRTTSLTDRTESVPRLVATVETAGGTTATCWMSGGASAQTDPGSIQTLVCPAFIDFGAVSLFVTASVAEEP